MTKRLITTEEKQRIKELHVQGWSYKEIGKQLGRSAAGIRYILDPVYRERDKQRARGRRRANPEMFKESFSRYYQNNKEAIRKQQSRYYQDNKEAVRKYNSRYYQDNKEAIRKHNSAYSRTPKGKAVWIRSQAMRRRQIAKYRLTQSEKFAVDQFRMNAPNGYHVDHVYPLAKGGLEHPWNLQYLTAEENLKKKDKVLPNTAPLVELVPGGYIPLPDFLI